MPKAFFVTPQIALGAVFALFAAGRAEAHPHIWVKAHDTILFDHGAITGVRHDWTFDEGYAASAIEGLDTNNDGLYDQQELAELTKDTVDGLKDFASFTFAKRAAKQLTFGPPKDYSFEYAKGVLTLHVTLPLEQPVPAEPPAFVYSVYDPTCLIAFDFAKRHPVTLSAGAPRGCKATIKAANIEEDRDMLDRTFGDQVSPLLDGMIGHNSVEVVCRG